MFRLNGKGVSDRLSHFLIPPSEVVEIFKRYSESSPVPLKPQTSRDHMTASQRTVGASNKRLVAKVKQTSVIELNIAHYNNGAPAHAFEFPVEFQ